MARSTEEKWHWCMDWCWQQRIAPAQYGNWDRAEAAYEEHIKKEIDNEDNEQR